MGRQAGRGREKRGFTFDGMGDENEASQEGLQLSVPGEEVTRQGGGSSQSFWQVALINDNAKEGCL